jgi:hypothetical protein
MLKHGKRTIKRRKVKRKELIDSLKLMKRNIHKKSRKKEKLSRKRMRV